MYEGGKCWCRLSIYFQRNMREAAGKCVAILHPHTVYRIFDYQFSDSYILHNKYFYFFIEVIHSLNHTLKHTHTNFFFFFFCSPNPTHNMHIYIPPPQPCVVVWGW